MKFSALYYGTYAALFNEQSKYALITLQLLANEMT